MNIIQAVEKGNLGKVKELIEQGADVNMRSGSTWTPLHYASNNGNLAIVKLLVENGADVNAKAHGRTPLDEASWNSSCAYCRQVQKFLESKMK